MRANDPLYEVGMTFGGHCKEDKFWIATLTALGAPRRAGPEGPDQDHLRGPQTPVASRQQHLAQLDDPQRAADHHGSPGWPGPYAPSRPARNIEQRGVMRGNP